MTRYDDHDDLTCPMCCREACQTCAAPCEHTDPLCVRCCRLYHHNEPIREDGA